jgi:hypothetical protein
MGKTSALRKAAPEPDPAATAANPSLLDKILANSDDLSPDELATWRSWVQEQYCGDDLGDASATRALNLNPDGSPLTFTSALRGEDRDIWRDSNVAELDRFFDTGCWHAILPKDMAPGAQATYYGPKVREKLKTDRATGEEYVQHRVRGTIGGDRLPAHGLTAANTAETDVIKSFFNSVVSTRAKLSTADISDFYLGTQLPPDQKVYVWVPLKHFTDEILDRRNLRPYIVGDAILMECDKTIFGLKNAGRLSKEQLNRILAARAYHEDAIVPCIYRHDSNGVTFVLVVDDFAISYHEDASRDHLLQTLTDAGYKLDVDLEGKKYVGLTIDYDREAGTLDISMPGYVDKLLKRFQDRDIRPAESPIIYTPPVYGAKAQMIAADDPADSTQLSDAKHKTLQEILGTALYYAKMVDLPTLPAVSMLATDLSTKRMSLEARADRLLGHLKKYPNAKIRYYASDMVYHAFSDVSYLSVSNGRSRAGGVGYFGWRDNPARYNGAVTVLSKVLDVVVSSACEGEYGAAYMVARNAVWIRAIARALGHPQPPTTILVDNTCAIGLANDTIKTARTKAIDVRFHWLRDRVRQEQFRVVWVPSGANLADFFTKALPVHEHTVRRTQFSHSAP